MTSDQFGINDGQHVSTLIINRWSDSLLKGTLTTTHLFHFRVYFINLIMASTNLIVRALSRERVWESNGVYFKRFNKSSRRMSARDDAMIILAFTYGLIEGDQFWKLVGRDRLNVEGMICKVNQFLRWEAESTEIARMEGKMVHWGGKQDDCARQHQGSGADNHSQIFLNKRFTQRVQGRHQDYFQPYRKEAYDTYSQKSRIKETR